MPSNDWTQTPPPVPDGMPEGTEWCRVYPIGQGGWYFENHPGRGGIPWQHHAGRMTALAFPMPDEHWSLDWEVLKPVQWCYATSSGRWVRSPMESVVPVSARWALMVPPRVHGGAEAAPPTGATAAP